MKLFYMSCLMVFGLFTVSLGQVKLHRSKHRPINLDTIKTYEIGTMKSYFFTAPNLKSKIKSYLVWGDQFNVLKTEGQFYYIEYLSQSGQLINAWIKKNTVEEKDSIFQKSSEPLIQPKLLKVGSTPYSDRQLNIDNVDTIKTIVPVKIIDTLANLTVNDKVPEFPGGIVSFGQFLHYKIKYPTKAREHSTQGRVIVSFIVEINGELSNIKVVRGVGEGCDEEAIRVMAHSPKWKPAIKNGEFVRVLYSVPISFTLSE